jgi:multidrug efflux pump subunit AcrB
MQTVRAFNQNIPLGNYVVGELNYDFRIQGELASPFDLLDLPIIGTPSEVRIQDLAEINYEYDDESMRTFGTYGSNGYYSTTVVFNKQKGADIFSSAENAKQQIDELLATQQFAGIQYSYTNDLSDVIQEDYKVLAKS